MFHHTTRPVSEIRRADSKAMITERVRGEFREMPGLALTLAQAQRLWGLDTSTCSDVLSQLVDAGYLRLRADGAFCRASDLAVRSLRTAKASIAHENTAAAR